MDRRLLSVLGMSVVLALVVAGIFYQVSSHASAVVAAPVVVPDEIIMIRGREKTVELIGSKEAKKQ